LTIAENVMYSAVMGFTTAVCVMFALKNMITIVCGQASVSVKATSINSIFSYAGLSPL